MVSLVFCVMLPRSEMVLRAWHLLTLASACQNTTALRASGYDGCMPGSKQVTYVYI